MKTHAKMKELDPVGGRAPVVPPGPANGEVEKSQYTRKRLFRNHTNKPAVKSHLFLPPPVGNLVSRFNVTYCKSLINITFYHSWGCIVGFLLVLNREIIVILVDSG